MPLIEMRHVSRRFGSVPALRDVNIELAPGTIGLVGNNGSGKSTLLKIILGLLAPDSGSGMILGHDLRRSGRGLRGMVGYMPETAALVPVLRGVEFVTLSGDLYGMPHRDAQRRAHEMLDYVGLGELRYRRLEAYSTGNLQRLKLAAALVHDPQLLLLDEPTNGLDPVGRQAMLRLIKSLLGETAKSVILCSHLLGDVERICQQVVVLQRGEVLLSGDITRLHEHLRNRYRLAWRLAVDGTVREGAKDAARPGDAGLPNQANRSRRFLASLTAAGADVGHASGDQAVVTVPAGWSTRRFFQLAAEASLVLVELTPEEEDLEQMFHRVTQLEGR